MKLPRLVLICAASAGITVAFGTASWAQAQDAPRYDTPGPDWKNYPHNRSYAIDSATREAWLADCRRRLSRQDRGLGGAAIGGVVGGIAGNRIAGRGNRTVGTIAGAAVGAAAGLAIDKAADSGRVRDECEAYLDDYYARYQQPAYPGPAYGYGQGYPGYGGYGYGYAEGCCHGAPMMMVPVTRGEPECTETIEYEYIDEPVRAAPPPRPAPRKRVKIVPDKRVPVK